MSVACSQTTATVITKAEIDKIGATEQSQRTRDENDNQTEGYCIVSGGGWVNPTIAAK